MVSPTNGGDLPREPPREAVRQDDGSYSLELEDGSSVRWTKRPDGTWRRPERKRAGWVGELEQKKYIAPGVTEAPAHDSGGISTIGQVIRIPGLPPGAAEAQAKASSRNERKKEQRKERAEAKEAERVDNAASIAEAARRPAQADASGPKSEKALEKKLRQIAELEEKQASGATLNEDQMAKIAAKDSLIAELNRLRSGEPAPETPPVSEAVEESAPTPEDVSPPEAQMEQNQSMPADQAQMEQNQSMPADQAASMPDSSAGQSEHAALPEASRALNRKAIEKKLRQIADIEAKQAEGKQLNDDQLAKLSCKAQLEAELRACP